MRVPIFSDPHGKTLCTPIKSIVPGAIRFALFLALDIFPDSFVPLVLITFVDGVDLTSWLYLKNTQFKKILCYIFME